MAALALCTIGLMVAMTFADADARRRSRGKTATASSAMLPSSVPFPRPRPGGQRAEKPNVLASAPADRQDAMSMVRVPTPQWPGSHTAKATPEPVSPVRLPDAERLPPIDADSIDDGDKAACVKRLKSIAVITEIPAIAGPGACGVPDAIRVEAIKTRSGRNVDLKPHAHLRCGMAEAIVRWMREDIAPSMEKGSPLATIMVAASYHCRARNNIRGARLSQHGLGLAMDVRAFRLANGTELEPTSSQVPKALRQVWQESACNRFSTVLGPGSDGYHEDHVHVDLTKRRRNYSMCRWALRGADSPAIAMAPTIQVWPRTAAATTANPAPDPAVTLPAGSAKAEPPPGTGRSARHSRRDSSRQERAERRQQRAEQRAARRAGRTSPPPAAAQERAEQSESKPEGRARPRRASRRKARAYRRAEPQLPGVLRAILPQ